MTQSKPVNLSVSGDSPLVLGVLVSVVVVIGEAPPPSGLGEYHERHCSQDQEHGQGSERGAD